jgi:hypothetical protein
MFEERENAIRLKRISDHSFQEVGPDGKVIPDKHWHRSLSTYTLRLQDPEVRSVFGAHNLSDDLNTVQRRESRGLTLTAYLRAPAIGGLPKLWELKPQTGDDADLATTRPILVKLEVSAYMAWETDQFDSEKTIKSYLRKEGGVYCMRLSTTYDQLRAIVTSLESFPPKRVEVQIYWDAFVKSGTFWDEELLIFGMQTPCYISGIALEAQSFRREVYAFTAALRNMQTAVWVLIVAVILFALYLAT